ncbi:amidotransferase [Ventosimonas gracilis]|uniref:Amidotransferase n=1 Tax=Ventosimonas gracilis TaxID=1680762 RepID=A0A139SWZ1_9GAMM|nr:amidotransferase [Ventosimonas gracilis]KXU38901.1 amidotransferase [Ventosimonas gracilis]
MTVRICILETDILRPQLIEQYKSYGTMFQQLFSRQPLGATFHCFNVVQGHYPDDSERFDAYLITGSKADSFGQDDWIGKLRTYLLARYQNGDKLLGVCFGHQLMALLLGGKAERASQGWGVGVHQYRVLSQEPWMQPASETFNLLVSHQDQVTQLPEGAQLLASSDFCPNAAYRIGGQVLCFQGHPEFTHEYSRDLLNLRREAFGETVYQAGIESLAKEQQGAQIAEWMIRFCMA